jgi:2,4-diaminopentanoate dehydrogenase
MNTRVVVWGTGNVGRPAIRAVAAHRDLDLVGVVVANPDKVGVDAGELAYVDALGVVATDDVDVALAPDVDAVVYAATADGRPEAYGDLFRLVGAGKNVVSTSFYPLLHPPSTPPELREPLEATCSSTGASVFVSGIDPGWAFDILPALVSGVGAGITEIRMQEVFNYALYDQPDVVRNVIGFGLPMSHEPQMLTEQALQMVWGSMVRVLADMLDVSLEAVTTHVERRPLDRTVEVPGMGTFDAGTQGAFRFEVQGIVGGRPFLVCEHITRIDDSCAPEWPSSASPGGEHRLVMSGHPHLVVSVHGTEPGEPGAAGGGNASAANRIVNAIPAVCAAAPGVVHPMALATITGGAQLRP